MDFSQAFIEAKAGKAIARSGWNNTDIKVMVQFPNELSANTLPYLYMVKGTARFPLDLSCESLFAEDWTVVD